MSKGQSGAPARPLTRRSLVRNAGLVAVVGGGICMLAGWMLELVLLRQLGITALLVGAAWLLCSPFTADEPLRPEARRYLREFFPAIFAYVAIVFVTAGCIGKVDGVALRWLLALLPVLPIAWIVRAMLRHLLASDELEQRIQLEAIAIAAATVGLASLAGAFLAIAGLVRGEHLLVWVLPALFAIYGVANFWIRRRYRGE